jgi:hypothetical protein
MSLHIRSNAIASLKEPAPEQSQAVSSDGEGLLTCAPGSNYAGSPHNSLWLPNPVNCHFKRTVAKQTMIYYLKHF